MLFQQVELLPIIDDFVIVPGAEDSSRNDSRMPLALALSTIAGSKVVFMINHKNKKYFQLPAHDVHSLNCECVIYPNDTYQTLRDASLPKYSSTN